MDLSIVVPAYNEERRLQPTLDGWAAWMDGFAGSVELVVSDDCSSDGTAALVDRAAARDSRIRLNRLAENQGKGGAVRSGMRPFEAHLVLAAVQDAARHGEVRPTGRGEMAAASRRSERLAQRVMLAVVLIVVLASAIFVGLVAWIVSGPTAVERAGFEWPSTPNGASSGTTPAK